MNFIYLLGKFLFFIYFKTFNRLTIVGKDNIPVDKGVLLCSNHISNFDPPLVGVATPRKVRFMAKAELFSNPIMKWLMNALGTFPVKRGLNDKQALRNGINILNNGEVLGFFPEGTRSKTGKLGSGLAGAGFFALRSDAVVVPCAIVGSYKPFKKIIIIFGKPVNFKEYSEKMSAKDATAIIMEQISGLLESSERNI
ncbi:1-acyl-sn-glycerol-3-phosphate acyltransferase [Pueribacillus theae]|uniref:1-acyl-sn-glycerol-3-phosphate acyltransferase n=1 Tax=Pueribacillus theae TaxID=2171751 RepID=A0A2U1K6A3_9BACI|nr:lysophospholipid acyltransferase family protein [Pueribacillus theae]PWA12438.1 1-acyl-sn-glycerol-3-phosphate acyltransferase [Pueribacillus theae]